MGISMILDTHYIGTLPLSVMSQADSLSYIQTESLRQHNLGQRPTV